MKQVCLKNKKFAPGRYRFEMTQEEILWQESCSARIKILFLDRRNGALPPVVRPGLPGLNSPVAGCYLRFESNRQKTEYVMKSEEKLVLLREWNTVMEAEMAKSILDSAGIFSTIQNEYMSAIYPIGTMPAQLMVKQSDLERASALLDKMQ